MAKLTALGVKRTVQPGRYGDGGGLWLQVRDAERRSWLFRYTLHGRAREMGLGALKDMTLAEARDAALASRKLLLSGLDPIEHRQEARIVAKARLNAHAFRGVAARYIESHEAGWRNPKHAAQWGATLATYAYPVFGERPVATVDTAAVMEALEPIWRTKPETASRLRGRIEAVLNYAKAQGWCSEDNPARWRGHLSNLLPARRKVAKVKHHAALPYAEVSAFMHDLTSQAGTAALALRLVILTACRTGEAIGAKWREVDAREATWTVPAERMKAGQEHRVPLTTLALTALAELRPLGTEPNGFVFPGPGKSKHLSNAAMTALLRRMGRSNLTVHGFRSTFRDWAAEVSSHPRELAEKALAHTLKDKVEASYQRGDLFEKRRAMMTDWAAFCDAMPAVAQKD
jgi:integrase